MTRDEIVSLLEECSECCLDDEAERVRVADRLVLMLRMDADLIHLRGLLEQAPPSGRLMWFASNGVRLANLIDAAEKVAGVEQT